MHLPADGVGGRTDGEFTIPRKTHFSLSGSIGEPHFSIYYPGYGPFPGFQVEPKGDALQSAFQEHTTVELRRLKTRAERIEHAGFPAGTDNFVPRERMPNLLRLINQELRALGLPPY